MHEVMHAHLVDFVCPVCIFRFAHLKNKLIIIIMTVLEYPYYFRSVMFFGQRFVNGRILNEI